MQTLNLNVSSGDMPWLWVLRDLIGLGGRPCRAHRRRQ